jgi:RNA polymerase sigma-70 factor (ECF subfamily)
MESSAQKSASKRERADGADLELVAQAKAGHLKAFEQLMSKYEGKVYSIAYRMTGNREDAEEVLQETFLSVYKSLGRFKGKSRFSTWLYRIAVNASLMRLRKTKKKTRILSLDEPIGGDETHPKREVVDWSTPEDIVERKRLMEVITRAIDSLPETYRAVVLLRDGEGLSNSEVAKILKTSVPAVKSKLHRARMHLREKLSEYFTPKKTKMRVENAQL